MNSTDPEPEREDLGDDNAVDDEGVEDAIAEELDPPKPRREYRPGHRQAPRVEVASAGPSPWERPRDKFTASMTERVPVMQATKQAGYVKGTSREA